MKIEGSHRITLVPALTYALMQDPAILAKCIPGCDELKQSGPDEYDMKMKMAIASVQGLFTGHVRITDQKPPEAFRLTVDGKGKVGFMKGDGILMLTAADEDTEIRYEGDVSVGGMIAGIGQRLIDTSAKFIIKKFFENLEAAATASRL